jgi:hypothetical protein
MLSTLCLLLYGCEIVMNTVVIAMADRAMPP